MSIIDEKSEGVPKSIVSQSTIGSYIVETRKFDVGEHRKVEMNLSGGIGLVNTDLLFKRLFLYNQLTWNNRVFNFNVTGMREEDIDVSQDEAYKDYPVHKKIVYKGRAEYSYLTQVLLEDDQQGSTRNIIHLDCRITVLYTIPKETYDPVELNTIGGWEGMIIHLELFPNDGSVIKLSETFNYVEFKDLLLMDEMIYTTYRLIRYSDFPHFLNLDVKREVKSRIAEEALQLEERRLAAMAEQEKQKHD